MNPTTAALVLAWLAIAILALALSGLVRQVRILEGQLPGGSMRRRLGPAQGGVFDAPDELAEEQDYVLIFADTNCASCIQIIPRYLEEAAGTERALNAFVAFRGEKSADSVFGGRRVLENQSMLFMQLGISATPFAVRVTDGRVAASGLVGSVEALRELATLESEG